MAKIAVKHLLFIVTQNPMTKTPKLVPEWHNDLLYAKFGEDKLHVEDERVVEIELPDVDTEVARLRDYYGADVETGAGIFDSVFGRGHLGKRKFEQAMQDAVVTKDKGASGNRRKAREPEPEKEPGADNDGGAQDPLDNA